MNLGTRIRTAVFIIAFLNQANVSLGVWEFGNDTVNLVYKIFSYFLSLIAGAVALWFNNDFTPEASYGTGITRQLKAEKSDNYVGERFFIDADGEPIEAMFPEDEAVFDEEDDSHES